MIHARLDYQRIQDPALHDPSLLAAGATPIGEDEPVMLFRAQDKYFPAVLHYYRALLEHDPLVSSEMTTAVEDQILAGEDWAAAHGAKTPDL